MARLAGTVDLARVIALAVDGTSGTLVAVDDAGRPVAREACYNDRADDAAIAAVGGAAPADSAAHGATSPARASYVAAAVDGVTKILHQADWIAGQISGRFDVSDENNALKTGYDPIARNWPAWIANTGVPQNVLRQCSSRHRHWQRLDRSCKAIWRADPCGRCCRHHRRVARRFWQPAPASLAKPSPRSAPRWFSKSSATSRYLLRITVFTAIGSETSGCRGRLEHGRRRISALLQRRGHPRNQPPD